MLGSPPCAMFRYEHIPSLKNKTTLYKDGPCTIYKCALRQRREYTSHIEIYAHHPLFEYFCGRSLLLSGDALRANDPELLDFF